MKQSMAFKKNLLPLAIACTLLGGPEAKAAGIPVYCFNCQEGSHNAANSILDGIRSQTEALLNGMDYTMRTQSAVEDERELTRQKTKNDRDFEPSLGAKPRAACSQMGAAALRGAAASGGGTVRKALAKSAAAHNKRSGSLAPGESSHDYDMKKIFEVMDPKDSTEFDGGEVVLDRKPIEPADVADEAEKLKALMNPYPVGLPPEEQQEWIKEKGTPEQKRKLSESVVLDHRLRVPMKVLNDLSARDIKMLRSDDVQTMIDDIKENLTAEDQAQFNGDLSENQLDELMSTYRVRSATWIADAASAEQLPAIRDIMLTNAELLNQMWRLNRNIEDLAALTAMGQAREITQEGLQSR